MSTQDDGGPAFPSPELRGVYTQFGMTLRDYFAAKAMSGWLASYPRDMDVQLAANGAHVVASFAYVIADAMLKARQQ